ncbi:FAD-dependent oxidoreductase [Aquihabitans sp. McL0605]|uniref:FAD-dependent oxidoreductase n=1 Tax=Aquihabitans sp. McL0605 TaxID=3415671 RepID=UPI003CF51A97
MTASPGLRVVVIGAGPGGLAAARLLQLRGHSVTVLERLDRAGGMCHSVEHDGRWFDIGGNYVTSDYREVLALAKELDLPLVTDQSLVHQKAMDPVSGKVVDATEVFNAGHSMFAFLIAAIRYFGWQWRYRRMVSAPGYRGVADLDDLMVPFGPWLRSHKMAPLQKLFSLPITAMGYGPLDEVPTPHALRYLNASIFWSLLKTGLHIPQAWPKRFVGGFGSMWQVVADQLDVEYDTTTISVARAETVRVVTERGGERQTREFDRLILAMPPSDALGFLDATEAEQALYAEETVLYNRYVVATANVTGFPWWVVNELQPGLDDTPAWPEQDGHPFIFGQQWEHAELTLFYAPIATDVGRDQIEAQMKADAVKSGRTADPPMTWGTWQDYAEWPRYFPRVSLADMESFDGGPGWYDQVEAIQGDNHTYLCHSVLSFELVERVARYARDLVEHRFR